GERHVFLDAGAQLTVHLSRSGTESSRTRRWREADSNFQFLRRAFLYRLGVTAPFLASSRNASGTAFVASNRGRPRRRVTLNPRLMTSSCRSALDECAFSCTHGPRSHTRPWRGVAWNGRNLAKRPRAGKLRRR